ncbi:MAG: tRNA (N6-threonylcarbamoyladenosine(37)-N6)-methyltransferase TrmO [Verrucomicrobiota bacterium]
MHLNPIGIIETPYAEKFGAPRQPGLVEEATGVIRLEAPWDAEEAVRGLEEFSHIWVIYGFHLTPESPAQLTVRPPRLGGNERVGVFASRSPFRPNRLGLSLVQILGVEPGLIEVGGVDIVDRSPVYDLKPYLPWVESQPDAIAGFAAAKPETKLDVEFEVEIDPQLRELVRSTIAHDPRPAYLAAEAGVFGVTVAGLNVRWRVESNSSKAIVFEAASFDAGQERQ